ncbi:MAG: RluA family pseudouridine synthase [Clostridia bacterium]|nr:RluA family pseudouridine synthase [Clostridia bacterium]
MLDILYEDKEITVCKKPVGILSQASEENEETMCTLIEARMREQNIAPYVGVIHRLDRNVGGVMVYAKTKNAAAKLSAQVSDKDKFTKQYFAAIHGRPETSTGEMQDLLFKDTHLGKSFVVDKMRKGVKDASLEYELLSYNEELDISLVKILLHTGRTHQIRVQFSSRKMPLCGDKKYGARDSFKNIGLWSYSISFLHPQSGKRMTFAAMPQESLSPWDYFDISELTEK